MVMTVRPMRMSMFHLTPLGLAHFGHYTGKANRLARKRVIAVDYHLVFRDIGNGIENLLL